MTRFVEKLLCPFFSDYTVKHKVAKKMTIGDYRVKKLKKVSFEQLKEKMLSVNWYFDYRYPKSLFTKDDSAYFHAGIWEFDGVGYIPTLYGRVMGWRLQNKIAKTLYGWEHYKKPYIK